MQFIEKDRAHMPLRMIRLHLKPRDCLTPHPTPLNRFGSTPDIPLPPPFFWLSLPQCLLSRLGIMLGEGLGDQMGLNKGAQVAEEKRSVLTLKAQVLALEHLDWLSGDLANVCFAQSDKGAASAHVAIARWAIS